MTTAREIIADAHRLLGLVSSGNSLPEAVFQDNLAAFNLLVQSWNTERMSVFCEQDQVVTWPSATRQGTIGPTGSLARVDLATATRPVQVQPSSYFVDPTSNLSYAVAMVNQQQYNSLSLKTITSTYPQVLWVNPTFPDVTLTVYPVPTIPLQMHVVSVEELTGPATLSTTISLPPGYLRAFKFAMAVELAPEFNMDAPAQVTRLAAVSKRAIRRLNVDVPQLNADLRNGRFSIYTGLGT